MRLEQWVSEQETLNVVTFTIRSQQIANDSDSRDSAVMYSNSMHEAFCCLHKIHKLRVAFDKRLLIARFCLRGEFLRGENAFSLSRAAIAPKAVLLIVYGISRDINVIAIWEWKMPFY